MSVSEAIKVHWVQRVLDWYDHHGRKDLPWQQQPTPYSVWVSETMLQQTQVSTVLRYYQRFIQRFPTLGELAVTPVDDVLPYWAGLGYYRRAHLLHAGAYYLVRKYGDVLPSTLQDWLEVPGVGRSTAGAILALGMNQRGIILDGNVQRLLARWLGVMEPKGSSKFLKILWQYAEALTPDHHGREYGQVMMDLGAMICTTRQPRCDVCPIKEDCQALEQGIVADLPVPRASKQVAQRRRHALLISDGEGQILLIRRPGQGVWPGLYVFPELPEWTEHHEDPWDYLSYQGSRPRFQGRLQHRFSHFQLDWILWQLDSWGSVGDVDSLWYAYTQVNQQPSIAVPSPVAKILKELALTRQVFCRKYQKELPGLVMPPFPGTRGQKIFEQVSQQAWQEWLRHQTMLINENHLNVMESSTQTFLTEQLEKFLDNSDYERPKGYVPPKS